jgi:adenosylhomocysteine nucleosidase
MPPEARCLANRRAQPGELVELPGRVSIQLSGIGPRRASRAAESLLDRGATALLSWGTAGALVETLQPGSLVLPRRVLTPAGDAYDVDADWHARVVECLRDQLASNEGPLLQSSTVVADVTEKSQLFNRLGAVAVDMESVAVAAVAARAGVPFIVIRAVADAAHTPIPQEVLGAVDAHGKWRLSVLAALLLRRPRVLVDCMRLLGDIRAAYATLTQVARLAGPSLRWVDSGDGDGT